MLAVLLFLLASAQQAQLLNDTFDVPAREYRFIPIHIANWPATLGLSFHVDAGAPIRVELVTRHDLNSFVRGKPYEFLVRLSSRTASQFWQAVPDPGDYDVLLINEAPASSTVKVISAVEFAREPDVARYVTPARRAALITVSIAVFLIALVWSAVALLRAMRAAGHT